MPKITGLIKSFTVHTQRLCKRCDGYVESKADGLYCINCGKTDYTHAYRDWYAKGSIDVFDRDFIALYSKKAFSQLLEKIGINWRHCLDQLKEVKQLAWYETWQRIANDINEAAESNLVGTAFLLYVKRLDIDRVRVIKIGSSSRSGESIVGERFVGGSAKEITEIAEEVLPEYKISIKTWVEVPVVSFSRELDGVNILIGLRAPVLQYGKAYRIWMRANNVHMYPSTPTKIRDNLEWVYRFNHTAGWKTKLRDNLEYCKSMEDQLVRVVKAAKLLPTYKLEGLTVDLQPEVKVELLDKWKGGPLWNLVQTAAAIDRSAGVQILKNAGFLKKANIQK